MTARKDSEKDSERPHYYSQFWLDIAAGKRIIGGPKPEDGEALESEAAEPVLQRRPGRVNEADAFPNTSSTANGYQESIAHSSVDEEYDESEEDLAQDDSQDSDYQEGLPLDDDDVPDVDLSVEDEEFASEEKETSDENDPEYEEDDAEWGSRAGRKKGKPARPSKAPVKKPGKTRRF